MSDLKKKHALPELLCPVGSPEALDAAIEGGADAVYLGGSLFNARMNAHNFNSDALRAAVLRAHTYGVKVYQTVNTLFTDREREDYLRTAREAYLAGVDALIVADLGGASAIHELIPSFELHASTQMSGHCADMGHELKKLGFSRMVIARETSAEDIETVVRNSPIEVEIFVHGALCVSHSGQCLFSSLVGGRSGNRGECAQPCRLPYSCASCAKNQKRTPYPLSLKDLSLATHVPEVIRSGVASLKIEGRMKSPEYVYETARIWRRLLDEARAATPDEMQRLANAFSRGGFTDGSYKGRIDRTMLGIRSEGDKESSRTVAPFAGLSRRIPLTATACIRANVPATLTLSDGNRTVTVEGDIPMEARNAPLTEETVLRNLSKTGGTAYEIDKLELSLDGGLMLPISRLNDLRRRAIAAWEDGLQNPRNEGDFCAKSAHVLQKTRISQYTARFTSPSQITDRARAFFDRISLPLHQYTDRADDVILPPVIFDSDRDEVRELLARAISLGCTSLTVGNLGHLPLARECGLPIHGDFRLNVTNNETVARLHDLGFDEILLSPELTLPQIRDIGGKTAVIVYGRIPLMTLEKCVIRELADCTVCDRGEARMTDRRGIEFPILREWKHRNVVYNSLPTCMSDRIEELCRYGISNRHFIFSNETPREVDEVIEAFEKGLSLPKKVRRMLK
ncbi:MAG: U32 family peptidase [Clostridia bacterium]|nr:U32 family peptidase [Clostridia bacterium]